MNRNACRGLAAAFVACALVAPAWAAVPPQSPLAEKTLRHPDLHVPTRLQPASGLAGAVGTKIHEDLAALGVNGDSAFFDARAGRLTSYILSEPLIPGTGAGNRLQWPMGVSGRDEDAVKEAAWSAIRGFLQERQSILGVNPAELGEPRIAVVEDAAIVQVHVPRVVGGIPVRDSNVTAVLNHGNLVLLGLDHWADAPRPAPAAIGEADAQLRVERHAAPFAIEAVHAGRLEYVPMVKGEGYDYRLVWAIPVAMVEDQGSWEGLVDAATGELIAFEDRNHYARKVIGGVYPISNDQRPPDGVEQVGWPMPFANIGGGLFTNQAGTAACSVAGPLTTTLNGQFVRIQDVCGAVNESAPNDLDLGSGPTPDATDCTVPAGHSAGDTKSARSGFYELNRIKEQARGYLPANAWLSGVLPSNMNINNSCNAFWSTGAGTVNFYRSSATCRNTGEIAAIFDHEWGHGMDANGAAPGVSSPGEGIADIHAFLRLNNSCVGRGFWKNQVCTGYGDGCIGTIANGCTGIREMDFNLRRCNRPHTVSYITQGFTSAQCGGGAAAPACPAGAGTPCGRATHCEGSVVGETAFDLARRDLTAPPFSFDSNTAHELTTRLFMIGSGPVTGWYTCAAGGGCGATGGYLQVLAVDDDNGNLTDGTPHMTAIRAAFERHEIHCATPAATNSGCATGPTAAPVLTLTPGVEQVGLSWTAVPNAARYYVYRTEGVFGCNFGKIKIGDVTGTTFTDANLLAGSGYSYMVLPVGASTSCFGRASNCTSATPTAAAPCAPTADFSLSCAPSSLTVNQGASGTSTCTVQSSNGFSAAVNLSCAGLPANVTCAYVPPTLTPAPNGTATSTLTVTVGGGVPAGTYGFQAQGVSGALTHTFAMNLTVNAISVAPQALTVDAAGNSVFQPNETVVMAPTWRNTGASAVTLTGATSNFTGPAGATYTNPDASAAYGTIPASGQAACTDCYSVNATAGTRPVTHWDSTIRETVTPGGTTKDWTLHIGDSFTDVPPTNLFYRFIETIIHRNVTGGCSGTAYCPGASTTREQMAVFVLVSKEGPGYTPPACTPPNLFTDVPDTSPFCRFIEELANRTVVAGCGPNLYCPSATVTREQMSIFVLRTLDPALNPPNCTTPMFNDVPASSPFCRWIEELARRGVVTGCGGGAYCPSESVSREQMSVFLAATFGLTLYGL